MKNNFTQLIKHTLLYSMLILVVSAFSYSSATAQGAMTPTFPEAGIKISGESGSVSYNASGWDAGVSFILYYDMFDEDHILGSSNVQGMTETISFTWPFEATAELFIGAYTGDIVASEAVAVDGTNFDAFGTASSDFHFLMTQSGARYVTSESYDLDVSQKVVLTVGLKDNNDIEMDKPIVVQYSADGGAFTNLSIDALTVGGNTPAIDDEEIYGFDGSATFSFNLPEAAKSENTMFKIIQLDAGSPLAANSRTWNIESFAIQVGESYQNSGTNASTPTFTLQVETISNVTTVVGLTPTNTFYGGEDITVTADFNITDLDIYNYAVVLEGDGDIVELNLPVTTTNSASNTLSITGEIPVEIRHNPTYAVNVYPFDKDADALIFGSNTTIDFSAVVSAGPDNYDTFIEDGGIAVGDSGADTKGLLMDQAGERSVLTPEIDVVSEGSLNIWLARASNAPSLTGTDLIIEYTTNGTDFMEIETVPLNDLAFIDTGMGVTQYEYTGDTWIAGLQSSSTQLRIRQEANNGSGLDDWYLKKYTISSESNVEWSVTRAAVPNINIEIPEIELTSLDNGPTNLSYPMVEHTLTYEITEGEFPAGSGAMLMLDRPGNDSDIILSTIDDVTTGSFDFNVPPIKADNYDLYIKVDAVSLESDDQFSVGELPIYNVSIDVTSTSFSNSISLGGEVYALRGSDVTLEYTVDGDIGPDAEIVLSVWNADDDVYEIIGADVVGTEITATLPTGFGFGDSPNMKLSIGSGVYLPGFSIEYFDLSWSDIGMPSKMDEFFDSYEGKDDATYYFNKDGARSATSAAFDLSQGGTYDISLKDVGTTFNGSYNIIVEGSANGTDWVELEKIELEYAGDRNGEEYPIIPNALWSSSFQLRLRQENEEDAGDNGWRISRLTITRPEFMETADETIPFNILAPTLDVEDLVKTEYQIGESLSLNFNALNFPDGTEFAAVFTETVGMSNYQTVVGSTDADGATSMSVTLPVSLESADYPGNMMPSLKHLSIIPYTPIVAGDELSLGVSNDWDPEDILSGKGYEVVMETNVKFEAQGDRFIITKAIDLTEEVGDVTLNFTRGGDMFDLLANKNTIPRLEVSIDGGATFSTIPVTDDEDTMYEEGFLNDATDYTVAIPAEYVTAATHFKWSQPLNQGIIDDVAQDIWSLSGISISYDSDNIMSDGLYDTSDNNDEDGQAITVGFPSVADYTWSQVDADTDAVYNGGSFSFSWELDDDAVGFPAGTEFTFSLEDYDDPQTQDQYIIGTASSTGEFTGMVPSFVTNGSHRINVTAIYTEGDDEIEMADQEDTGGRLDVYLQVITTTFVDPGTKVYAGTEHTFSYAIENDVTGASDTNIYDELYYNLIMKVPAVIPAVGGPGPTYDDLLLASQQGLDDDFVVNLPTDQYGSFTFEVKGSEDGPLGEIGELLDAGQIVGDLDEDDFINFYDHADGSWELLSAPGERSLTSKDLEIAEAVTLKFTIDAADLSGESETAVVLEYSTDGGATYTTLMEVSEDTDETYLVNLPEGAMTDATRFRFRQEESDGTVKITSISFGYVPEFPFQTVGDDVTISKQTIQITSIDNTVSCSNGSITINYEVNGVYGPDAMINVFYKTNGTTTTATSAGTNTGFAYPVEGSTGSISLGFASDDFNSDDELVFTLQADNDGDETTTGDQSALAPYTIETVEIVAPINEDDGFWVDSQNTACELVEIFAHLSDERDYYTYQFTNAATGEVLGGPFTYDPDVLDEDDSPLDDISLGILESSVTVNMWITSGASDGTTCNTQLSTDTEEVIITPAYSLYLSRDDGSSYSPVITPETICEGSDNVFELTLGRVKSNGSLNYAPSTLEVEWFRGAVGDFSTPVDGEVWGGKHELDEFSATGEYFARITEEDCSYTTESISITVVAPPLKPEVSVVGDLLSCGDEIEVFLSAPDGFEFYKWSNGVGTQSMTVTTSGTFTVQVSNVPFGNGSGCVSPSSTGVVVQKVAAPTFRASTVSTGLLSENEILEGSSIEACTSDVLYFYEDNTYTATGTVIIYKDGVKYSSTTAANFKLTESGVYSLEWVSSDFRLSCAKMIGDFTVTISEIPVGSKLLSSTGALKACADELAVTLTAPTGFGFYKLFYDADGVAGAGAAVSEISTSNVFEVSNAGDYYVSVGNNEDCISGDVSNVVTLKEVTVHNSPTITLVDNANCGSSATSIEVSGSRASHSYQIHNSITDLAEGSPKVGNGGKIELTSSAHDEVADFYVVATRTDGTGCAGEPSSDVTGKVNNVLLRASGNVITAQIESVANVTGSGSSLEYPYEIIWYRNGTEMLNVEGTTGSITVIDDATYSVEVIFEESTDGACTVSSNAITLGGGAGGNVTVPEFATSIYPNPTRDEFNLKVDGEDFGVYSVQILSLSGKVVFRDSFDKQTVDFTIPISIRNLKAGIYTVIINNNNIKSSTLRISKL